VAGVGGGSVEAGEGADAFALLVCPVCGAELGRQAGRGTLRCGRGHAFDVARQGYVNLLPGDAKAGTADTAEMVRARAEFLAAGHYAPLAHAIADLAAEHVPPAGSVLDAGAGTGYYLAAVLEACPGAAGLALDVSKYALRRAGRAHERMRAAVWDVWRPLPVRGAAVDVVLNVFAPRNAPEFRRVLRPGGTLLVVTPGADHLAQLRSARAGMVGIDAAKAERLAETLTDSGLFTLSSTARLSFTVTLTPAEAADAIGMGPSARHTDPAALGLAGPIDVTASFVLSGYRPA
jgi:23S rRNA (guanine745-N1)-methyltransferase